MKCFLISKYGLTLEFKFGYEEKIFKVKVIQQCLADYEKEKENVCNMCSLMFSLIFHH